MMHPEIKILTIDGPSGVGKGTVSQIIAKKLGWHFLDSGAIYRCMALAVSQQGIDRHNTALLADFAAKLVLEFVLCPEGEMQIQLFGQEVSAEIRAEEIGTLASKIAVLPEVRAALLHRQHDFAQTPGLVADGRDMGTVVFPNAAYKVFLSASAEERAKRRHKQLIDKGLNVNLHALLEEIEDRDRRDRERKVSPLQPAKDALLVDTTNLSIEQVVARINLLLDHKPLGDD